MHPEVERAIAVATKAHGDQKRRYTGEPYVVHPILVMKTVATRPHTIEQLVAAVLHDVVEDTTMTVAEVGDQFGHVVSAYVDWLTDASVVKDPVTGAPSQLNQFVTDPVTKKKKQLYPRDVRTAMNREKLAKAPDEVKTIKIADMIDNTESITVHDVNFAVVYMKEKALALEVLRGGDQVLWDRAATMLKQYQESRRSQL